jgi:hypothetical protein
MLKIYFNKIIEETIMLSTIAEYCVHILTYKEFKHVRCNRLKLYCMELIKNM